MEISTDWLQQRAEQELKKIQDSQLSFISSFLSSQEKKDKIKEECVKSLAKIEMIKEIFSKNLEAVQNIKKETTT